MPLKCQEIFSSIVSGDSFIVCASFAPMFSFLNRLLGLGIGGQGLFCSQYCGLILESFLFPSDLETLKLFTTNGGKFCLNFCSQTNWFGLRIGLAQNLNQPDSSSTQQIPRFSHQGPEIQGFQHWQYLLYLLVANVSVA